VKISCIDNAVCQILSLRTALFQAVTLESKLTHPGQVGSIAQVSLAAADVASPFKIEYATFMTQFACQHESAVQLVFLP
jgi:hypothetical protein